MKYSLLVINEKTNQETLFNGFGNESLMIKFINKHWRGFNGFDVYGEANLNFIDKGGKLLPTRIISQMELE